MTGTYFIETAIAIMNRKLANARQLHRAAMNAGLPLPVACALMEKESGGRNIYGHDPGGALEGFPGTVNRSNWEVFWWMVDKQGHQSNGVGPAQLTYPGFFRAMLVSGLQPWSVEHNARYGFHLLADYHVQAVKGGVEHPWVAAGERYNGSLSYGEDLVDKIREWRKALAPAARRDS